MSSVAVLVLSVMLFGYYAGLNSLPAMAGILLIYAVVARRWRFLWLVGVYLLLYLLLSSVALHPRLANWRLF
jgi:hypothetical protein